MASIILRIERKDKHECTDFLVRNRMFVTKKQETEWNELTRDALDDFMKTLDDIEMAMEALYRAPSKTRE